MTENAALIEIDGGRPIWAVTFSANGEHLVSGDNEGIRVWQVADGKEIRKIQVRSVRSIAVSADGRYIAAGTELGRLVVLDAKTYETIFSCKIPTSTVKAVDFSPDSLRLVTGSGNCTATIWDFIARARVLGPLHHPGVVVAAKYSAQGDCVATACADPGSVRIYNCLSGQLLLNISINVIVSCNAGLTWSNDSQHLFVVSEGQIKQIQASTRSVVEEWPVQGGCGCVTLSQRGKIVACSSNRSIKFFDPPTGTELGRGIEHDEEVHSIALSPDDRILATSIGESKIIVRSLQDTLSSSPRPSCCPFIDACGSVLGPWMQSNLDETETSLEKDIESRNPSHCALAHRSLIRSRRFDWDAANDDAKKSVDIRPSVIGLIAKSVALVGVRKKQEAYRACDLAFKHCPLECMDDLLMIKAVVVFLAGEYDDAISRVGDVCARTHDSVYHTLQAYMRLLYGNLHFERKDYKGAIDLLELAHAQTPCHASPQLGTISLISGWQFDDIHTKIRRNLCEVLYAAGRTEQAEVVILEMAAQVTDMTNVAKWICDFIERCLSTTDSSADTWDATPHGEHAMTQTFPLSPSTAALLIEWTRIKLTYGPWKDVLAAAAHFTLPRIMVYKATCEGLEVANRLTDAINCFNQMVEELSIGQDVEAKWKWVLNFRNRCSRELEDLGDAETNAWQHDGAIHWYSAALTLGPKETLLAKRSVALLEVGKLDDALEDANEIIKLDSSSFLGYERKHAALRAARRYSDAIDAFKMTLSTMSRSPDPKIRDRLEQYVRPEHVEAEICRAVHDAVHDLPRVLINTESGHLLNRSEQASVFKSSKIYTKLVSAMTTHIDTPLIKDEVAQYYRYATLSHAWEDPEPLFESVVHVIVYELEKSATHDKLQMFCKIVREAGFIWAWSDNCCINKQDHSVRDEALLAMFKWYAGAALVVVFLRGVPSPSKRGDLMRSNWNTRAWTFQEYLAAKVVRFYNEDWTLYRDLDIPNHKDSPEIVLEMEEATGISAEALKALKPGTENIREKLSLASLRKATYVEDKAYSLFGIFGVALQVRYGEGNMALGRLLAHLLASSGDTSILAWTGKPGGFNSCLPADIAVFNRSPTSHIPSMVKQGAGDTVVPASTRTSPLTLDAATELYQKLSNLSVPSVSGQRIKIPCIAFKLGRPVCGSEGVFRAKADALGTVEITTTEDLSRLNYMYLVHPWIDFLLDRQPVGEGETLSAEGADESSSDSPLRSGPSRIPSLNKRTPTVVPFLNPRRVYGDSASLASPSRTSLTDTRAQVLQFTARLGQPFGPLLLTQTRRNIAEFKRVATDSNFRVQIRQDVQLNELVPNVGMLDLL